MTTQTFAQRCKMFEQCLPDAPYRTMLTQLHAEMLTKLAEQPAQQEPNELIHIGEQDFLGDVNAEAWRSLIENRGGCRCFLSPPCGACSNPISEQEMNEVGYTYTTPQPPAQPAREPVDDNSPSDLDYTPSGGGVDGFAPQAQQAPVQGWKLVPLQPTSEMVRAYDEAQYSDDLTVEATNVWVAMLGATPQAQPKENT